MENVMFINTVNWLIGV